MENTVFPEHFSWTENTAQNRTEENCLKVDYLVNKTITKRLVFLAARTIVDVIWR